MTNHDEPGDWLPLAAAAGRLGISVDAMRSRVRRGLATTRRGNDGKLSCLVSASSSPSSDQPPPSHDQSLVADDRAELAAELVEVRIALARSEAALSAKDELIVELKARIEAGLAAKDELISELKLLLAERRRPWWRWFG